MKKILLLLLISGNAWAQQAPKQMADKFNALLKVEDKEKFYNELVANSPADSSKNGGFNEYRGQLAVDWLLRGNIVKYKSYKSTHPRLTSLQLFDISNQLEYWEDQNKNVAEAAQISNELLEELQKKIHADNFDRTSTLLEVNAMANCRLGNIAVALKNMEKSSEKATFRNIPYFRNSKANYLKRYAAILAASGQEKSALDTLSQAIGEGNSTAGTIATFKEVYKKVNQSSKGMDTYLSKLQEDAYNKIYKEVEKAWLATAKPAPDLEMKDMDGKSVRLSDYKGKIVVIDFWSTACKPCVAAFPAFERVVELYKNEPFKLFVINTGGEERDDVKLFMDKKAYHLDVLFDQNEAIFTAIEALGTPQKFIIDPQGNINQTGIGYTGADDKEFYKLKAMVELSKIRSSAK